MSLWTDLQKLKLIFCANRKGAESSSTLPEKQASSKAELDEIRAALKDLKKAPPPHTP